eukprot:TRINITY_DN544_c0_g1_i4.p1 TRINITY_DN544_c0_g1~~TRINITY_DN544_c0_g1_i4.p1  ORF type:complete len:124 (-),score=43.74 TRINITY_DN544_c0_g1_i4:59-430(-)
MSYNLVESCHVYVTFLFAVYEYYLYYHVFLETSRTVFFFFFLMIRRPPRSTLSSSSAASDVYKRQHKNLVFIPTPIKGHFFVLRGTRTVSYTHLRAHETPEHLVCRLLLEKKKKKKEKKKKKK